MLTMSVHITKMHIFVQTLMPHDQRLFCTVIYLFIQITLAGSKRMHGLNVFGSNIILKFFIACFVGVLQGWRSFQNRRRFLCKGSCCTSRLPYWQNILGWSNPSFHFGYPCIPWPNTFLRCASSFFDHMICSSI